MKPDVCLIQGCVCLRGNRVLLYGLGWLLKSAILVPQSDGTAGVSYMRLVPGLRCGVSES